MRDMNKERDMMWGQPWKDKHTLDVDTSSVLPAGNSRRSKRKPGLPKPVSTYHIWATLTSSFCQPLDKVIAEQFLKSEFSQYQELLLCMECLYSYLHWYFSAPGLILEHVDMNRHKHKGFQILLLFEALLIWSMSRLYKCTK